MKVITYGMKLNTDRIRILVKESEAEYEGDKLTGASQINQLMCDIYDLHSLTEEHTYMLAINKSFELLGVFEISHGSVNESHLKPREVFSRALLVGAAGVYLVRYCPGNIAEFSENEYEGVKHLYGIGSFISKNLGFMDHITIGGEDKSYYSMHEAGYIEYDIRRKEAE